MSEPRDRLDALLACHIVELELRLERRVRLNADRLNQRLAGSGERDLYDTENDRDLAQVLMLLCETALDEDEHASGLASDIT